MWHAVIRVGVRFVFCLSGFDISVNMAEPWWSNPCGRASRGGFHTVLINPEVD